MSTSPAKQSPKSLDDPIQFVKGVGPNKAMKLRKLGLHTVRDVLYHIPWRYEDRRNLPAIGDLRVGQEVTVRGHVLSVDGRPTRGGMHLVKATLTDGTGQVTLVWFNKRWLHQALQRHEEILAFGTVKAANWGVEIHSPEWEPVDEDEDAEAFARLLPVYKLTEGVDQRLVRSAAERVVESYVDLVQEPIPKSLRDAHGFLGLKSALRQVHRPENEHEAKAGRDRLVFEEFLVSQLALAMRRAEIQAEVGIAFPISQLTGRERTSGTLFEERHAEEPGDEGPLWAEVHKMLPFELTNAQRRVIGEIWGDMEQPHPMNRLLQGDVGSGKTAVAAAAILAAVRCGYQAAIMAPTEILAEQHIACFRQYFNPVGIEVALLVGKQTAAQKRKQRDRVASGEARVAVGTHALIQESVQFQKLGLIVVDEQHRFGVLQRATLHEKGYGNPDVLVMTATPIPRTLSMTLYGDMDTSILDEKPKGRREIKTHWKQPGEREAVYELVREFLEAGKQAYFVCPLVGESEKLTVQAAEDLYYRLSKVTYPDLRVGMLHGQMKNSEKEETMERFRRGELDILVSTTVIEVGVDVPNATVMVIEDANRFGLAQLHQLRGRVGRDAHQSYCILIGEATTEDARERLNVMVSTNDGFEIARKDMEIRGPGEIAGTKQSGNLGFEIADLRRDAHLLTIARQAALGVIESDPRLERFEHSRLLPRVLERRTRTALVPQA